MLQSVSVLVLDGVAVFEFGVICEVFGLDRSSDGVPKFDFKVCGLEAGRAVRTSVGASLTPDHDLSAFAGADVWDQPIYFHPYPGTLGYNDGYFLSGLIYSGWRLLSDPFLADTLTAATYKSIGYVATLWLVRGILRSIRRD